MSERKETKNKTKNADDYVKTFRCGAVAANVFSRQAPGGFEYLVFNLSRAWKTSNSKEGYSQNFFANNDEALHAVIDRACDFIYSQDVGSRNTQLGESEATATRTRTGPALVADRHPASGKPHRTMHDALEEARNSSPNGRDVDTTNAVGKPDETS